MNNLITIIKNFIKIKESKAENKDFEDDYVFIEQLSDSQLAKAVNSGKEYLESTDVIRLHQKYMIKNAILDEDNELFKDYDPRSLNFMLEYMCNFDQALVNDMEAEIFNRAKK